MIEKEINQTLTSLHIIALGEVAAKALWSMYSQKINAEYTCIGNFSSIKIPEGINVIPYKAQNDFLDYGGYECRYPKLKIPEWHFTKIKIPDNILNLFNSQTNYIILVAVGGFSGTLLIWDLSAYLELRKINFTIICFNPFNFEGRKRRMSAFDFSIANPDSLNIIQFNLDDLKNKYGNMTLKHALNKVNEKFFEEIKHVITYIKMEYVYNKDSVLKWMKQNRRKRNKIKKNPHKTRMDELTILTLRLEYQYLESIYKKDENSTYKRGIFPSE